MINGMISNYGLFVLCNQDETKTKNGEKNYFCLFPFVYLAFVLVKIQIKLYGKHTYCQTYLLTMKPYPKY